MNVSAPILSILETDPERLAVREPDGTSVDYAGLQRRVVALADLLGREGLAPGDRVVLQLPAGIAFTAAAFATLLAGGVPVLAEPGLGDAVYLSRIRAARAQWALVHPLLVRINRVPGLRALLRRREIDVPPMPGRDDVPHQLRLGNRELDRLAAALPDSRAHFTPAERALTDEAAIVFTGGTTSAPKGVVLSHGALDRYLGNIASVVEDLRVERFLADTPQQVLYALRLGRSAFTTKGRQRRRARHVLRLVQEGVVDAYFGSPYVWVEMMAMTGPGRTRLPATLRTVLLGSAPVTPRFLRNLRTWLHPETRVLALYGLTEAGPVCVASVDDKLSWAGEGDLVGTPLPGVRIDFAATKAEGVHAAGEVIVRSDALYSGYLGQPARNAEDGLATGDLGRLVEHAGRPALVLLGRAKDMIIRRSVNIYPGTLEPTLLELADARGPLLADGALVGVWDEARQDEEVVLCAVPAAGRAPLDAADLLARAAKALGPEGQPDRVQLLEEMPVTGRQNKLDRAELRRRAAGGAHGPSADVDWQALPGARVPFRWKPFVEKYALLLRHEGEPGAVAGQVAFRLALWAAGQGTWALDELVARRWRRADDEMTGPLFILGHQRSGTTFLQRLLARDTTHARALALHEMLLPAVSAQNGLRALGTLDARLGGHLSRRYHAAQERLFGPLDEIHRLRFEEVEEDEFVLWAIFASLMCANDAPSTVERRDLDELRHFHRWPARLQAEALGWYRACLLKKIHREPPADRRTDGGAWIVSKNPAFTHKVPELRQVFPDARFIYLVRNPLETIPSRLSLIRAIWRRRLPGFRDMTPRHVETILEDSVRTYLSAERDLPPLPADRWIPVRYDALTRDPRGVVEAIYARLGLTGPDDDLRAHLRDLAPRQRERRSKHAYTLAEFGLDEATLRQRLAPVFERYGWNGNG